MACNAKLLPKGDANASIHLPTVMKKMKNKKYCREVP